MSIVSFIFTVYFEVQCSYFFPFFSGRRIVVVLTDAVKIYTFELSPDFLYQSQTVSNPQGICHVCQDPTNPIIAFPGQQTGGVTIVTIPPSTTPTPTTSSPPPLHINAHQNALVALTVSADGDLLATASERGTLVRVFDTRSGTRLYELRRGTIGALITCITFDHSTSAESKRRLAVVSDHGTIHIFIINSSTESDGNSSGSRYLPALEHQNVL